MAPPIELRRTGVGRDRLALRDVADLLHLVIDQHPQHGAAVIRLAANEKLPAISPQPSFSHSTLASKPPDAATGAAARTVDIPVSSFTIADRNMPFSTSGAVTSGCTLDRLTPDEVGRMADFLTRASALISKRKAKLMIVCGQSALAQAAKEEIQ